MTHSFPRSVLAASTALAAVLAFHEAVAIKVSPPPNRQYVSQTWVGFSTDDRYTIRLILNTDGAGSGLLLSAEASEAFEVVSWVISDSHIAMSVHFHGGERRLSRIEGTFKRYLLSYTEGMLLHPERQHEHSLPGPLELRFKEGAARVRFGMWPELQIEERLNQVKSPKSTGAPGGAYYGEQ